MVKICLTDNAHSVSQVYFYPSIHTQAAVHFQGYEAKRNNVPYLGGSKMHPKVWAVLGYAGLLLQPARPGKASPAATLELSIWALAPSRSGGIRARRSSD